MLGILKRDDILQFIITNFTHKILNNEARIPAVFSDFTSTKLDTPPTHGNLYKTGIRTDYGRFMFRYKAAQIWGTVPTPLKRLTGPAFKKQYMLYLLNGQM